LLSSQLSIAQTPHSQQPTPKKKNYKMQFLKLAIILGLYATSATAIWCGYVVPVSI